MLDVITDFWKPSRKAVLETPLDLEGLRIGSSIGFGFVPQSTLSGKRFTVSAINTYQFGEERLTSFVLSHDGSDTASMIVAEAEGEKYLALSRRIPEADRNAMFGAKHLDDALSDAENKRIQCNAVETIWKQWTAGNYKKEIHRLSGKLTTGDYRTFATLPADAPTQSFDYTLFVSDNNEYAIEAERYSDGKLELYATIYRRISDIGEVQHMGHEEKTSGIPALETTPVPAIETPADTKAQAAEEISASISVSAANESPVPADIAPTAEAVKPLTPPETPKALEPVIPSKTTTETKNMAIFNPLSSLQKNENINGVGAHAASQAENDSSIRASTPSAPVPSLSAGEAALGASVKTQIPDTYAKQEVKAVSTRNGIDLENEAIECDLRVANKIIEEAIRNELRLSDVVRRIIALPVAYPESVQIPVTLSDADFQLLAIRYGIPATDRTTIKNKIIEEINDFSGNKKQ